MEADTVYSELKVQCETCFGTGVIPCEDKTVGILCFNCNGRGYEILNYIPFAGRQPTSGILKIKKAYTFAEFLKNEGSDTEVVIPIVDALKEVDEKV